MTERRLRDSLGIFLVMAHVGLVLLIVAMFGMRKLLFEEMTTAVWIIAPYSPVPRLW